MKLSPLLIAPAIALALPAVASAQQCDTAGPAPTAYATGVNCRTLEHDGERRRYLVYVPANARPEAPLVFMFHGSSGTGEQFLNHSGWREQADATGLIAVFPTGLRYRMTDSGRLVTKWADFDLVNDIEEDETPPADDVGFVDAMLADLAPLVDERRVYASGFSNGAGFAARLAVDRSETFAAVAFSGGGLTGEHSPARRVPTYETIGSLDPRILDNLDPPLPELPLDPEVLRTHPTIAGHLGLQLATLGLDPDLYGAAVFADAATLRWPALRPLYRFTVLEGLGHAYPDRAPAEFWEFFSQHRL